MPFHKRRIVPFHSLMRPATSRSTSFKFRLVSSTPQSSALSNIFTNFPCRKICVSQGPSTPTMGRSRYCRVERRPHMCVNDVTTRLHCSVPHACAVCFAARVAIRLRLIFKQHPTFANRWAHAGPSRRYAAPRRASQKSAYTVRRTGLESSSVHSPCPAHKDYVIKPCA